MSVEHNARRYVRTRAFLKVQYDGAPDLVDDYTENISRGGLFIVTDQPLQPGMGVRLFLSFPGLLEPLHVDATVRWVRDGLPRGVGVEIDPTCPATAELARLVERVAAADPQLVSPSVRLLIVSDDPTVPALLRDEIATFRSRLSGNVNFELAVAETIAEAQARLASLCFDLVVVDAALGEAPALLATLRAERGPRHPIVGLGQLPGADFCLRKPWTLLDILTTLQRLSS